MYPIWHPTDTKVTSDAHCSCLQRSTSLTAEWMKMVITVFISDGHLSLEPFLLRFTLGLEVVHSDTSPIFTYGC